MQKVFMYTMLYIELFSHQMYELSSDSSISSLDSFSVFSTVTKLFIVFVYVFSFSLPVWRKRKINFKFYFISGTISCNKFFSFIPCRRLNQFKLHKKIIVYFKVQKLLQMLFVTSWNKHHKISFGGCNLFNSKPCFSLHVQISVHAQKWC